MAATTAAPSPADVMALINAQMQNVNEDLHDMMGAGNAKRSGGVLMAELLEQMPPE